jgi:polysaccharide biosynthesis/export protein
MLRVVLTAVLMATTVGCATGSRFDYTKEPDPRIQEYLVGPGDSLRINVWRDQELSGEYAVRPDGTLTLPLIGDLRASGRSTAQIRDELQRRLATFMKAEQSKVTVAIMKVNSYRFAVAGNVEHPGVFNVPYYVTVIEAMAMAGGPNRFAAPDRAKILRTYGTGMRQIPINYETLKTGEHPEQNIVVLSGDTLVVP